MFKPPFDDLRAPFCRHAADVGNLVGLEPVIESKGEVIQPKLALVPSLKDMHMDPLTQIVAIKADPVAILDEHRRHLERKPSPDIRNRSIRKGHAGRFWKSLLETPPEYVENYGLVLGAAFPVHCSWSTPKSSGLSLLPPATSGTTTSRISEAISLPVPGLAGGSPSLRGSVTWMRSS